MIKVDNKYDFTVEELTDILNNTPIAVDMSTNAAVAGDQVVPCSSYPERPLTEEQKAENLRKWEESQR